LQQRNDLQQMVLHDIADGPDFFVKGAAALHAELFRHGDLNVLHVVSIPDRLQEGVGEAEKQQVLHRLLAQVVVDAKDGAFLEYLVQGTVKGLCARKVAPERLFHDHPCIGRATGFRKALSDVGKHARRNREIVNRPLRRAQRLLQSGKGRRIGIVAVHVAQ